MADPVGLHVQGEHLHVGDTIVDPVDGCTVRHIEHLDGYPGAYWGDGLRRAHGAGWGVTIVDHHLYRRAA
jgi:hypothetical protein